MDGWSIVAQLSRNLLSLVLLQSVLQFNKKLQKSSEFTGVTSGWLFFILQFGIKQGEEEFNYTER